MKIVPAVKVIEPTEADLGVIEQLKELRKTQKKAMQQNKVNNPAVRVEKETELSTRGAAA